MRTRHLFISGLFVAILVAATAAFVLRGNGSRASDQQRLAPSDHDLVCAPKSRPKATVMLFHPGGFISGRATDFTRECHFFATHRYLAVSISYPRQLGPAIHEAESRARSLGVPAHKAHRPVFAYGLSAGGTFAATLAARGDVDAAFSYAGIYDIAMWTRANPSYLRSLEVTRAQLIRLSPVNLKLTHPSPLLIAHNPHDIVAPYTAALRMARRSSRFGLMTLRRPANGYAAHILHPLTPALAFYEQHRKRR
jgi:hypothetical protein